MRKKLDLDVLDGVSGGLDLRTLQTHLGAPGTSDPFHSNVGGPSFAPSFGGAQNPGAPVAAGSHPIDTSHGSAFDPYGPPGHPTGVSNGGSSLFPQAGVSYSPSGHGDPSGGSSFNLGSILGAVPGVVNALESGNIGAAIPGIVNAIGGATGQNLGGIGSLVSSLSQLGGSSNGSSGNPFGGLGDLFGGSGGSGSQGNDGSSGFGF